MSIDRVRLGDLEVSAQGLGCMGMSEWYGAADWDESIATIHRALDLGVTLVDTADVYGAGHNEVLVGRAIHDRRDEVQLATKFGIDRTGGDQARVLRGDAAYVRRACDASLLRLGVETIDLYYLHRPPQNAEIEETVGAMAELVPGRQGAPPRALRGRRRPAAPGPRRAPDHRGAVGVLAVDPRPRDDRPGRAQRSSGWAWCPTPRSAGGSSPARSGPTGSARATSAARTRGSPARRAPPTRPSPTPSPRWRPSAASPRPRSRWPGCTARAPGSAWPSRRSPAPSGSRGWSRTSRPSTSQLTEQELAVLDGLADRVVGARY